MNHPSSGPPGVGAFVHDASTADDAEKVTGSDQTDTSGVPRGAPGRGRRRYPASRESVFGSMSRLDAPLTRRRRLRWLSWGAVNWGFLVYPIADLAGGRLPVPAIVAAGAALAVFAVAWLRTIWLSLATVAPFTAVAAPWAVATVVGTALAFAVGTPAFLGLFIYLSIAAAVALPLRWTIPGIVAATAAAGLLLWRSAGPVTADTVLAQLSLVFWLGIMMWFYRRMMRQTLQLRLAREELAALAVTQERLRFARDLHDLLGHSLSIISLKAQLIRRLAADPSIRTEITDIENVTRGALVEIRDAVTGYRATTLQAEIDAARALLPTAGITVTADLAAGPLPGRTDSLLSWVLREAVTNTLRHSRARTCRILLTQDRDTAVLQIIDDGVGPPERMTGGLEGADGAGGNGLSGLAERLAAAGGRLRIGVAPGGGWSMTARVPLTSPDPPGGGPTARR